jgi:hypothetical protein
MEKLGPKKELSTKQAFALGTIIALTPVAIGVLLPSNPSSPKEPQTKTAPAPAEATQPQMELWERIVEKTRKALSQEILP